MPEKPVTVIVSDLHIGGGPTDPGEDHVCDRDQFASFVMEQGNTPDGKSGRIELFINGDFLEFAQSRQEAYTLKSSEYWCSEQESLAKLTYILEGHPKIFNSLRAFQERGNIVTVAAGNHDIDLVWPKVREKLREVAGPVQFESNATWYPRYNGRLLIGHGHIFDPANAFTHWGNPILHYTHAEQRLEMCPGTLFMVKFVNWLEHKYPFADNIKPVTALRQILWKENKWGLTVVAWMMLQFAVTEPSAALSSEGSPIRTGKDLVERLEWDKTFKQNIIELFQETSNASLTDKQILGSVNTPETMSQFLYQAMAQVSMDRWLKVFESSQGTSLGNSGDFSLAIKRAGTLDDKVELRRQAAKQLASDNGHQVIVLGHTHQPDAQTTTHGQYFNPGSWTRYLEIERLNTVTLEDLRHEEHFPYQLNFVRVQDASGSRKLSADMHCFAKQSK